MTYVRAASFRLGRLLVRHEGVGGQGQGFVEQKQREEVGREGHPHGGGQRQREAGEVASLRALFERAHVTDGIERRGDPQQRGPRPNRRPKASTRNASSIPGRIRDTTHCGVRPAMTSGIIDATNVSCRMPAATDQNSLRLTRRSPARATRRAPTVDTRIARRGVTEKTAVGSMAASPLQLRQVLDAGSRLVPTQCEHQPETDRDFSGRHGDDEERQDLAARVLQELAERRQS